MKKSVLTITCLVLVVSGILQAAEIIFNEDLTVGFPGPHWQFYNSYGAEEDYIWSDPFYGLSMLSGVEMLNEAILTVDLTGYTDVHLFIKYGIDNSFHPPLSLPSAFMGHENGDGISISLDGVFWQTVHTPFNPTGGIDVEDDFAFALQPAGVIYIKFQIYTLDFYYAIGIREITVFGTHESNSVTVPNVAGLVQASAETSIIAAGLTVGNIDYDYSHTVPDGNVITQNPAAGTAVAPDSAVDLIISLGAPLVGSLKVTILPTEAVSAGAQWRRAGTTIWFDSGSTESDIPTGGYSVEFKEVQGWQEPLGLSVVIEDNQLTETFVEYTPATHFVVTIGTGTGTWDYPLHTYYHDARTQTIYRADEVGGAGAMNGLALYVTQPPGQTMNLFTIRLKHTDLNDYSGSAQWQAGDWTTVYQANQSITTTGWINFPFVELFDYNGTQNLMVDISFNNSSWTSSGLCRFSTLVGGSRSIYFRTDSAHGDPLTWSGSTPSPWVSNNAPNIRIYLTAENPVAVPDIFGLTQAQAESALLAAGLDLGNVSYGYSNSIAADLIFSQTPAAGSLIPEGFSVNIIISLGPIYSGGSGTQADPYQIASAEDLLFLSGRSEDYDKHFILTADIDLGGENFTAAVIAPDAESGTGGFQGTAFSGVFDGSDYAIKNLTITASGDDYIGLFGHISFQGQVKNLNLKNISISGGRNNIGGLAGLNSGIITACRSTGVVSGTMYVGGLCGYQSGGTISNSSAAVEVTGTGHYLGGLVGGNSYGVLSRCYSTGNVSGTGQNSSDIGGLCGFNDGTISDSYAIGSVSGYRRVGGLCGLNYKNLAQYGDITISRSYAAGEVSGSWSVGGLAGYSETDEEYWHCEWICDWFCDESDCWEECWEECWPWTMDYEAPWLISSSFWDIQTTGKTGSSGGSGINTIAMQTQSTFVSGGWNLVETWAICEGTNYPRLQWQILSADFVCPDGVDLGDLAHLASWWMANDCALHNNCDRADINLSGDVGMYELLILVEQWLQ